MLLFDKCRTVISLHNVTHVSSKCTKHSGGKEDFILTVYYIGGTGYSYNYMDVDKLDVDRDAIEKWVEKRENSAILSKLDVHSCGSTYCTHSTLTDAVGKDFMDSGAGIVFKPEE